jgi:hypothetical protein
VTPDWERRLALAGGAAGVPLVLVALAVVIGGGLSLRAALVIAAGLALILACAIVERRPRPGTLTVLVSAAVAGLVVAVNVLAASSGGAVDLTRSGLNTLSGRSVLVTRSLRSDLVITGVFRPDQQDERRDARTLLDLYQERSQHVKVRFADPAGAAAAGLSGAMAGSIVLQYAGRTPIVLGSDHLSEADITSAIVRLASARTPTVCWAAGDGERDLRATDEVTGYSAAGDLLRASRYRVQEVRPAQQAVPAACDALVVLQLGQPLNAAAVANLQRYLDDGGKLLLAVDPWVDPQIVASANAVLQPYGAGFDGGLVIEPDPAHSATGDSTVPVVYSFGASPITAGLDRRYVFLPAATPITGRPAAGVVATDLAATSDQSFAIPTERTDLSRRAGDRPGPFVVLRSIEVPHRSGQTRVVLAGTSALAENRTMPPAAASANSDLLLASLDWLTQQDTLVAIPAKPRRAVPLTLSPGDSVWLVLLTVPLPLLLIVAAGTAVLVRRRRAS